MYQRISTSVLKSLVPHYTGVVIHFCKTAGRLYGKLALREQLTYESVTHNYSSIEMVEMSKEELKAEVVALARDCANTIHRLNILARKDGLNLVLKDIDEMSLTDLIEAIDTYITDLVAESDYRLWVAEYDSKK